MQIELDPLELETLLESLNYSKLWVSESEGMTFDHIQEKLRRIEAVTSKLRAAEGTADE